MRTAAIGMILLVGIAVPSHAEYIATASDFGCLLNGTKVPGHDFVMFNKDPALLAQAVAMVQSGDVSAGLPEGTILQLFQPEAMVKRGGTFNPSGDGWEFFKLQITLSGTTNIVARGGAEILNSKGLSCQGCHTASASSQDLVQGMVTPTTPLLSALIGWVQSLDLRCH